jgi:diguanylate cyclase (GGDEF)-like protein
MKKSKLNQKKFQTLGKTYSIRFRFLATVILAMLAITVFIGGLSIYEVDNYIQDQSENFVRISCINEGERINNNLKSMEKSVEIMKSYLMEFFDGDTDIEDKEFQKKVIQSADQMFIDVVKHISTTDTISYYFRFDPSIADSKSGLFYSKLDGGSEFISLEPTDLSIYSKDDTEHVGWFWQPYEAQEPIWMKPYYNQNNNTLMFSYVIPMYYEKKFIGVVGMDFDYMALEKQVQEVEIYENGFAHLEIDGVIISGNEYKLDSKNYLSVSKELMNGMTLVCSANYDDILQIRYEIAFKILLIAVILSALFTLIVTFVVKKITDPLNKLTNAVSKLADGNYDMEIEQSGALETKLLSIAFENMAVRLRERENLLRLSANRDSMTGLRNTTSYVSWVAQFDKKIENGEADFGVVMLDLNDLKKTNDIYGHETGNQLIITSAKIISDVFKRSPVFRIGGDEFLVVLQNKDLENRDELFGLLDYRCQNTFIADTQNPIRIAIGFSRFEQGKDLQFSDVFKRADNAMYENKRLTKSKS